MTAELLGPVGAVVFGGLGTLAVVSLVALRAPQLRHLGEIKQETREEKLLEIPVLDGVLLDGS